MFCLWFPFPLHLPVAPHQSLLPVFTATECLEEGLHRELRIDSPDLWELG